MLTPKNEIEIASSEIKLKIQQALSEVPRPVKWLVPIILIGLIPAYLVTKNIAAKLWQKDHFSFVLTAKPSFPNPQPIQIVKTILAQTEPGVYAAAAEIANPNLDLLVKNAPYTFNLYNAGGELLDAEQGTFFLLPNQTAYLVLPRFASTEVIGKAELVISQQLNWKKPAQLPQVQLLTSLPYVHIQTSPPGLAVESTVVNTSPYTLSQIRLVFLISDQSGKIVSISQRSEFTISPQERRGFKQLFPSINSADGLNVQIFAYTNTADSSNISAPPLPAGSASGLGPAQNNP